MQNTKLIEKYNILWYYFNMEYKLIRSKRKTLAIKIAQNGQIIVLAPHKCSLKYIENFIKEKQTWIEKTKQIIEKNNQKIEEFISLQKIFVFGKEYKIYDFNNHYEIGEYYIKHTKSSNKQKVIKEFFIKFANDYIIQRTQQLSKMLNIKYNDIKIISARKKWGSCNNLKQLRFNFRLVMIPRALIDYVICHELCHIKELNHSKEFWGLLQDLGYEKTAIKQSFKDYNFVLELL